MFGCSELYLARAVTLRLSIEQAGQMVMLYDTDAQIRINRSHGRLLCRGTFGGHVEEWEGEITL